MTEGDKIVGAYSNQLLIVLMERLGGKVELDLRHVDEFPLNKGVSIMIRDLKPAPDLGEGRFDGTFVLELVDVDMSHDVYIANRTVGQA